MNRWTKFVAPVASLALLIGFHQASLKAADVVADGKAKVTVTVVDESGKPVAGAEVGIFPAKPKKSAADATTQPAADGKKEKPVAIVSGETAADGTVTLDKVPDGKFSVQAHMKGAGAGHAPVVIADDKNETVSITLKPRKAKN